MVTGLRKELMYFTRGGRLAGFIGATLALAFSSPIMFAFMSAMIGVINETDSMGQYSEAFAMFTDVNSAFLSASTVEYVASIGSIVMLFIFMSSAGGEQKKRSVIIPQCSGLSPTAYALPKFVIYPLAVLITGMLSVYAGAGISVLIFGGSLDLGLLTLGAVCTGLYMTFLCVIQFTVGLCTGRPGLAVVSTILIQQLLPSVLALFGVSKFNPMALLGIGEAAAYLSGGALPEQPEGGTLFDAAGYAIASNDIGALNVAVSIGTAVVISVMLVFLTLFMLTAKEVRNEGNDPAL